MAAIHELLAQVQDESLRARLEDEINKLSKQKKFGLVFEEHLPECTPLYDIPVKVGSSVAKKDGKVSDMYVVIAINSNSATCIRKMDGETEEIPSDNLVCVAEFGEPIYPFLKPIDDVCHAPDNELWHTLIEADNYHALQLLEYLYAGKVDCIYIDPPYNTGAKDWKYNNNYVDGNDSYRHSKWLSFMKRRLILAKKLLNPEDSVLIVTIDEKEYLHLGCLLEELFPEANIQMVSDVINRTGSVRQNMFARADEYIFFIIFGSANAQFGLNDMLNPVEEKKGSFQHLIRGGTNGLREKRPNLFYPVFFNEKDGTYNSIGSALDINVDRHSIEIPEGCFAVWPLTKSGIECTWGVNPETFLLKKSKGYISFGKWKKGDKTRWIGFLQSGTEAAVENGLIEVLGKDDDGALILGKSLKPTRALTVWNQVSHDAGTYGASLLNQLFLDRRFNYPKSLYSTLDAIRFFLKEKKHALVVDFFAGSGTTLHAVNLLNAEDDGNRKCILVTNNEVSDSEAKVLAKQGYKPGDEEWERLGIARYVTWPRAVCSIEGHDVNGNPLKGNYLSNDAPMANGFKANAVYFKLGFLNKTSVSLGKQFKEMVPLLWMKAGANGPCPSLEDADPPKMMICKENRFAVLVDETMYAPFVETVNRLSEIETVYIVTDSNGGYREMIAGIKADNTYQLYRDYLDNFRINVGRK